MKKIILLANGDPPKKSIITFLQKNSFNKIICADGGANSAFKLKIIPDYIIGDLDSIEPNVMNYYSDKSQIIKYERQNDTDVEKALKFAIKKRYTKAILLGATGDRLDHSFCNLGIVLKFFDRIKIDIIHKKSLLTAYEGKVILNTEVGETISLYGIDSYTTIKSSGLKYPLRNNALPFGEKESTSNVAISEKVELDIKNGRIFVVRDFYQLKKNDYFRIH